MTSQQGQLQALITEIEALLGRAAPRLPWMKPGEAGEQRRVMEQALAYLHELQATAAQSPGWELGPEAGAIAPAAASSDLTETAAASNERDSQQMLQALLQEMQYLRAQMVQPLTSEVMALQQQREALKNEVRQLEQERLQRSMSAAAAPNPVWVEEVVGQLRSSLLAELTPQIRALQSQMNDDPLALSGSVEPESLVGAADLPQLTPQQRLEQLRQIQAQTDTMLLRLDSNLRTVFESLDQSIQSYCDTLNRGLDAMHGLGQQGEFIFRTFINHLAEQLQAEAADFPTRLTRRSETARLRGQAPDWSTDVGEDTASRDELMAAIADFDEVDLADLDEVDLDAALEDDEEVTLFQLDEEFSDISLDDDVDEDWMEDAPEDRAPLDDPGEQTIVQTEPVSWQVMTGQAAADDDDAVAIDDEPTVAYTEEIDALYTSIFGNAESPETPAATSAAPEEEAIDQSLLNLDAPAEADPAIAADTPSPDVEDTRPRAAESPSLDLDFLLEAEAGSPTPAEPAPPATERSPLDNLMGAEMAAELSPPPVAGTEISDRITSLVELLPESEQRLSTRQADPFATLDESEDMFIPAPPDENLLDVESEGTPAQVELDLDDETLSQLTSDLSRLENEAATPTPPPSPPADEAIADEPAIAPAAARSESSDATATDLDTDDADLDTERFGGDAEAATPAATTPPPPLVDPAVTPAAPPAATTASDQDDVPDELSDLFGDVPEQSASEPASEAIADSAPVLPTVTSDQAAAEVLPDRSEPAADIEPDALLELTDTSEAIAATDPDADAALDVNELFPEAAVVRETDDLPELTETSEAISDSAPDQDMDEPFSADAAMPDFLEKEGVVDFSQYVSEDSAAIADSDPDLEVSELFPEATAPPEVADLVDEALTFPEETTATPVSDREDEAPEELADLFDEPTGAAIADQADNTESASEQTADAADEEIDLTLDLLAETDDFEAETSLATDLKLSNPSSPPPPEAESDRRMASDQISPPETRPPFPPVDEAAAASDIADFFGEATGPSADPDAPLAAENLSLDTFFEDDETDSSFLEESPTAATPEPPATAENITLETAFGDGETAPEPETAAELDLDDLLGEAAIAADQPADLPADEATEANLTLDDAFGEADLPEPPTAPPPSPGEAFTLENAFGEAADDAESAPSSVADEDFTLDTAFGAEPEAEAEPETSVSNLFSEEPPAPPSADDDAPLTLETLEDWSAGEATSPASTDDAIAPTRETEGDQSAAADEEDWSLTLDDISLELDLPDLPSDRLDFSEEETTGDRAVDETLSNLTLDTDLFAEVESAPADAPAATGDESLTPDDLMAQFGGLGDEDRGGDRAVDEPSPSELTLETDLFSEVESAPADAPAATGDESLTPDDLVKQLDGADLPDDIPPMADDLSLENWSASLEAADAPAETADELSFDDLDLNLSLDVTSLETEPDPSESAAESPEMAATDLFAELDNQGLPTQADESTAAPSASAALNSPPQVSPAAPGEFTSEVPDREGAEVAEPSDPPNEPAAFALTQTAEDGVSLTSDVPNDALGRSLAAIPDADAASAVTDTATTPTSEPPPATASTAWTVSGSPLAGYQLQGDPAQAAAMVDRALTAAPRLPDVAAAETTMPTEATPSPRQMGQRVISLADMVAATSLPFAAPVNLSNLPASDAPVNFTGSPRAQAVAPDAALPEVPGLPLSGSVTDGFAVSLVPDDALPAIEAALADNAAAAANPPEAAPLTDDELAALFPPDAEADPAASPEMADEALTEPVDQAFADLFPPSPEAESAPEEPTTEALADNAATATPASAAATPPTPPAAPIPDSSDWDPMAEDFPPEAAAADLSFDRASESEGDAVPDWADLDLSMEEIPESEIAADEVFRSAFEDLTPDLEETENAAASEDAAIADPDALPTDSAPPPAAREVDPGEPSAPAEPVDASGTTAESDQADAVFASSGMLATLGDATPEAAAPDADDDVDTDLEAEWFLGIDLGTSGLSAVLMEHYSGAAHPLCWVPESDASNQPANFRVPAIAAFHPAEASTAAAVEWVAVGPSAAQSSTASEQGLLHTLRPLLRVGIPHVASEGREAPVLQWSEAQTVSLPQVMAAIQALLRLISHPAAAELQLEGIGLESPALEEALANLQGVVMGVPTNWSDTYCFNLREAVLSTGLVDDPGQIFFVEEAIAAILSGLPDPNEPLPEPNRQAQALYQCNWQGGTVVISGGAACTEVGIVDLPQPLDALSREDFKLRNLAYGGDALDLDIICQLLVPPERRQSRGPGARRPHNQGWGWQAALPEVADAHWADLQIEALDLPQLAEPDPSTRQRLRQHLRSSKLGQSLLEAARYLKLILQNQNQYQLELADQSWRVLRRDLESRVLVPYIQRINQQVNALLSQTGLASQGINQVICTGGNASFNTIAKWLRQKFPNATIIQDTYPSDRPQTCSRVAYGLVNLCRYPQVLDVPRHQYGDYFLLHEMIRIIPDAPLPFDGILHLLEAQGINTDACQSRIAAILEGHLPPGLLPDAATRELLSRDSLMSQTYQDLAAGSLFSKQTRNIYMVNAAHRDRLRDHLATLMQGKQQSLSEPLIAQLVAV